MRKAFCALCARLESHASPVRTASTVASSSKVKIEGLPYQNRAQWEHEERMLVRQGLSPFKEMDQGARRLRVVPAHLNSAHLIERLGKMIDKLQIVEAIAKLREADRQALRPQAFNMLINACMRTGKEQLALDVFRDMKQRGLTPTPHTFSALLGGLLKTRNLNPRLLMRAKSVHREWEDLYRSSEEVAALADGKGNIPTNAFLQLLGRAAELPTMFETFYAMPREGPYAPNLHTYTVMLQALSKEPSEQNIASAISIWNVMCGDQNVPLIDAHAFSGLSEVLLHGSDQHRLATLHIARTCSGFLRALDPAAKEALEVLDMKVPTSAQRGGRWELHYKAISSIFNHLGQLNLSEIAIAWLRQILSSPDASLTIDATHVEKLLWQFGKSGNAAGAEEVLRLLLEQSAAQHRPTRSAYAYSLQGCLASDDIERAFRIFDLHLYGSADAQVLSSLRPKADVKCFAVLAALAYTSPDQNHALQVARIAETTGWLPWTIEAPKREPKAEDPDAVEHGTALTVTTELGKVNASRHALLMAARAQKAGKVERAAALQRQAETLAHSDAGVRAHYLSAHRAAGSPPDPDFVARAASREQALLREEHRNRYWEPKLARALLRCLHMAIEASSDRLEAAKWEEMRKPLSLYFAGGKARGVLGSGSRPMPREASGALQRVRTSTQLSEDYALVESRIPAAPAAPVDLVARPSLTVDAAVAPPRSLPPPQSAPRVSKKVVAARRRIALQGVRTRRRPRPDLVLDRRAAKPRQTLRLEDLRPQEGARGRRYV